MSENANKYESPLLWILYSYGILMLALSSMCITDLFSGSISNEIDRFGIACLQTAIVCFWIGVFIIPIIYINCRRNQKAPNDLTKGDGDDHD